MTPKPPKPLAPRRDDDENIKTVKLSTEELRQQLQDLGVDLDDADQGDPDTGEDPPGSQPSQV